MSSLSRVTWVVKRNRGEVNENENVDHSSPSSIDNSTGIDRVVVSEPVDGQISTQVGGDWGIPGVVYSLFFGQIPNEDGDKMDCRGMNEEIQSRREDVNETDSYPHTILS